MKKALFSFVFFVSLLVTAFFLAPQKANAADTRCYVNGKVIGSMEFNNWSDGQTLFQIPNTRSSVFFTTGDVKGNEVWYRVGTSSWKGLPRIGSENSGSFEDYFTNNNSSCGNIWANVMWRSMTDRKLHYCNVAMPNYKLGTRVDNFLQPSCVFSGCTKSSTNAKAAYYEGYISYPQLTGLACTSNNLSINGTRSLTFINYFQNPDCYVNWHYPVSTQAEGKVTALIKPIKEGVRIEGKNYLQFYDFVSNTYCGGNL